MARGRGRHGSKGTNPCSKPNLRKRENRAYMSGDSGAWRWLVAATVGEWFSGRLGSTRPSSSSTLVEAGEGTNQAASTSPKPQT